MSHIQSRIKHVGLAFLGDGWAECFVDFRAMRWSELKELRQQSQGAAGDQAMDLLIQTLRDHFVAGKTVGDDGQLFDLTADDLGDFDIETLTVFSEVLGGAPGPNA